jgi:cytoskeletal protein CcmA (bactofilin family)
MMSPLGKDSGRPQGDSHASSTITVIARDARLHGEISGSAPVRVEGQLAGKIDVGAAVDIAPEATVEAEVRGTTVRVAGTVTGDVIATTLVELQASGHIVGDITAPALHVVEGAVLEGRVQMKAPAPPEQAKKP